MTSEKVSIKQASKELDVILDKYDWFYSTVVEQYAITVYTDRINEEILNLIPSYVHGYHIKVGYKGYLLCEEKYGIKVSNI